MRGPLSRISSSVFRRAKKPPQAQENLALLDHRQVKGSLEIAKYYDKAKNYRAAVLYYNEVIRQQPGSPESALAKKRIEQLRAKVGDAAFQSAAKIAERKSEDSSAENRREVVREPPSNAQSAPAPPEMRGNPNDLAPLPPPRIRILFRRRLRPWVDRHPTPRSPPAPSPTPEASATP